MTDEVRPHARAVDENPLARREDSRRLRPVEDAPLPEKVEKSRRLNVMKAGEAPLPSPPPPQAFFPAADAPPPTPASGAMRTVVTTDATNASAHEASTSIAAKHPHAPGPRNTVAVARVAHVQR
jgi:hypothetical protein